MHGKMHPVLTVADSNVCADCHIEQAVLSVCRRELAFLVLSVWLGSMSCSPSPCACLGSSVGWYVHVCILCPPPPLPSAPTLFLELP